MKRSDHQRKLIEAYAKAKAGPNTFRLGDQDGKPGIWVGRNFYIDPQDAINEIDRLGLKSYQTFKHGEPASQMPRTGGGWYDSIESTLSRMVEEGRNLPTPVNLEGMSVDRISVSLKKGNAERLRDELMTDKGLKGLMVPSDDGTTLLRFYTKDGKELDADLTRQLMDRIIETVDPSDPGASKLPKRLKQMINIEPAGVTLNRQLTVRIFDPDKDFTEGLSPGARRYGFDGLSVMNPKVLMEQANKIDERINELLETLPESHQTIKSMRKQASTLRQVARTGGDLNTLRATGLQFTDAQGKAMDITGMVKGDVVVPSYQNWIAGLEAQGISKEDARSIDIFTSRQNVPEQFGRIGKDAGSYITVKSDRLGQGVSQDVQSLVAYGEELISADKLSEYSERVVRDSMEDFAATGKLPVGYRKQLEALLEREEPLSGELIHKFKAAQKRAQRLLDNEAAGIGARGDMLVEGLEGIRQVLVHSQGKEDVPHLLMPAAAKAHVRSNEYAEIFGFISEQVDPGELMYRKNYGWIMHVEDIYKNHLAHGTFDLDDTISGHLRLVDRESGQFAMVNLRSPLSHGEASVLAFDPSRNLAYMEEAFGQDPRYADAVKGWGMTETRYENAMSRLYNLYDDIAETPNLRPKAQARRQRRLEILEERLIRLEDKLDVARADAMRIAFEAAPEDASVYEKFHRVIDPGNNIDDWQIQRSVGRAKFDDWLTKAGSGREELFAEDAGSSAAKRLSTSSVSAEQMQKYKDFVKTLDMADPQSAMLLRAAQEELREGLLGRYSNVEMIADSLRPQIEAGIAAGVDDLRGIIPTSGGSISDIIDTLVQGGTDISVEDIDKHMYGTLYGIAEAVSRHGVKLNAALFQDKIKGGMLKDFWLAAKHFNPDIDLDDTAGLFLDINDPKGIAADFYQNFQDYSEMTKATAKALQDRLVEANFLSPGLAAEHFYLAEEEAADALYDVYNKSRKTMFGAELLGGEHWESVMAAELDDVSRRNSKAVFAEQVARFYDEDGALSDEGVRVLGAFRKKYGRRTRNLFDYGGLNEVSSYVDRYFEDKNIGAVEGMDIRPTRAALMESTEFLDDIPEEIQRIMIEPGATKRARQKSAYGAAQGILGGDPSDRKVYESFSMDAAKKLWDESSLLRRGSMAILGAIGFSAIYQATKDRTPEDMQGPPLLPGGSAYEDGIQSYPMPQMATMPVSNGGSGVTYRIIADGNYDPGLFQDQISSITGAPINGSIYGHDQRIPRPRYNARREGLFGSI